MKLWTRPVTGLVGAVTSFYSSLGLAAYFYPQPYVWQRTVMSALASPKDNPHAFGIACAGVALCAVFLLPFPVTLGRRLGPFAPRAVERAGRCLFAGAVLLLLTALVVPGHYRIFGVPRVHEQLARLAAGGFCLALIGYLQAVRRLPRHLRWVRLCALVFVAIPVAAFLLTRLALVFAWSYLKFTTYQAATVSAWGSLALWEWIGATCIFFFLGLVTLGIPDPPPESQPSPPAPVG